MVVWVHNVVNKNKAKVKSNIGKSKETNTGKLKLS